MCRTDLFQKKRATAKKTSTHPSNSTSNWFRVILEYGWWSWTILVPPIASNSSMNTMQGACSFAAAKIKQKSDCLHSFCTELYQIFIKFSWGNWHINNNNYQQPGSRLRVGYILHPELLATPLSSLTKEIPDSSSSNTNKHFIKLWTRAEEERNPSLTSNSLGKKSLACSWWANEKNSYEQHKITSIRVWKQKKKELGWPWLLTCWHLASKSFKSLWIS